MASELLQQETNTAQHYLDSAGFIIGVLDRDQNIIFANKKSCEVLGYSEDEIVGKNWFATFLPEDIRQSAKANHISWMAGECEPPEYSEMPILTRNGTERLIRWHDVVLRDKDGNITGTISSGEDITLHKQTEDALHESEMRNKAFVQALPDMIFHLSRDGTFLDYSAPSDDLLIVPSESIIGHNIRQLGFPEEVVKQSLEAIKNALGSGTLQKFEYHLKTSTAEGDYEARIVPCAESEVLIIIRDITKSKQVEETLLHYAEQLERSNELKDLFTDVMRHDLLNPAGIVKGFTEVLLKIEGDEKKREFLRKIKRNNTKLIKMIENASHLSKLESIDQIKLEVMDLGSVIRKTSDDFSSQLEDKHMNVHFATIDHYMARMNPIVEGVFANLLSNAIKYSPEGSDVMFDVVDMKDFWKANIADSGEGISDADKLHIFERFKRADKKGVKGTGLGLAIVKRIIDLHGGEVGVVDNPQGQGSMFWVTLKKA